MSTNSTRKELSGHDVAVMERPVADVDTIEQFLREQFQAKTAGKSGGQGDFSDPLMAELARIVGQDVRPAGGAQAPAMPKAHDPFAEGDANDPLRAFEEELRRFDAAHRPPEPVQEVAPAPESVAAEPFAAELNVAPEPAAELRGVEPAYYEPVSAGQSFHAPYAEQPPLSMSPGAEVEPEGVIAPELASPPAEGGLRSRKVLMMLGGAAAIALVGVVGSIGFGKKSSMSGDAPVIAAKTSPMKEKPADPGGVEVPGQDRQVLAKKTEEPKGAAQVVTKEEQPVDLNQTPKREVSRVILPSQGGAPAPIIMPQGANPPAATPAAPATPVAAPPAATPAQPATAGGFEAKRVRSVKINGDGEAAAPAPAPRPSTPTLATMPQPAPAAAAPKVEAPKAATDASKSDARPATAARPAQQAAATTPRPAAPRPAAPAPAAADSGDGPMSLRPPSGASPTRAVPRTAAVTPTSSPAESAGGGGGFSVQLAAPGSEQEARATAARLKQRHSDVLGSYNPGVRKAEIGDKTVYRVRVGGLSRESANDLCTRLKAGGGSCFVASN